MRRIGVLMKHAADDPEGQARVAAFLQGLQRSSAGPWAATRRSTSGGRMSDANASRKYATELVALTPDVIFATTFADNRGVTTGDPYCADRIRGE